ncbi:exosortase N [Flavilitoribacter nigricans]|uniref:Exosortase N n=1 Tax=Flavilitoribacter nigricans (strain ATCC 23147 / DSM 23189 / NBRC 102662 / NCIMB 1420 / SS-2) TaxID=1122177 RepID=A0A2D0N204_FLAN2|nr:exosortase N [Flavilitoribacter nigricans]PHN01763.1 exosortase N [Flavilitoribacter nigricans DSM 23189 = NBRC 102662]
MQAIANILRAPGGRIHGALALIMIVLIVGGYAYFNFDNQYYSFTLWLGLIFAPYIVRRVGTDPSRRWLWVALPLGLILCFRHSTSLFYFFCGFSVLYLLESTWGRLNNLPVFLMLLLSTLASQVAYIWSFPIRLQLSRWAADVLSVAGWEAVAQGNVIVLMGQEFSVDPACMGLSMLLTGSLLALFMLAHFERKLNRVFSVPEIMAYLSGVFLLLILANFTRLLALLVFGIMPDNPAHDAIGLFSLVVYVLLPFYFYLQLSLRKRDPQLEKTSLTPRRRSAMKWDLLAGASILVLLLCNGPKFQQPWVVPDQSIAEIELPGFRSELVEGGVLKLENDGALIYIKPGSKPFQATHDPRICWRGTGYEFTHIEKRAIGGELLYTAHLQKGNDRLYTAWWFDSGRERTVEEWHWRWTALSKGRKFRLVNVTALNPTELEREVLALRSIRLPD